MTNDELKNKIAKFICNACEMGLGAGFDGDECAINQNYRECCICGETADALIAAGIGDISVMLEYVKSIGKHRDEERKNLIELQNIQLEDLQSRVKAAEHRAEVAERALKECSKRLSVFTKAFGDGATEDQIYEILINKAKKELSEVEE